MRRRGVVLGSVLLALAVVLGLADTASADPVAPPGTPTATSFPGIPTVGPLFRQGLGSDHGCTAGVLASPGHDLILTAAHCVSGTAAGWLFAPGYDQGRTPDGVWTVQSAYVDPAWLRSQDPRYDYAILRVADQDRAGRQVGVQDVTGGNGLGFAPTTGLQVTDVAYNEGLDDQPIACTTTVYRDQDFPAFNCHGYVGGSSGSPWLVTIPGTKLTTVDGVIGGLHQGGCYEYTSYSAPFTARADALLLRAVLHARPDTVPAAGSDGC
jgi:V8-like Glu-specific endopeptidase